MVFTSLPFVGFFLVVYLLYRVLPHRGQNGMLVLASYYFYAAWDWRFLGLLIGSTVVDYSIARYLGRTVDPRRRRTALLVSLVYNLGVLGFFKYFDFFAVSTARLFAILGWHVDPITLRVILPIGISFYTFMTISYVIDVYRREIEPATNFVDFALFVCYFPHLVAGPILRASRLLPQIARPRTITAAADRRGAVAHRLGLLPEDVRRRQSGQPGRRRLRPVRDADRSGCPDRGSTRLPFRSMATSPGTRTSPSACPS